MEYFDIVDVTDDLNDRMLSYLFMSGYRDLRYANPIYKVTQFISLVKPKGPEDFKSNVERDNTVFNKHSLFMYNGEIVDQDALANIAYGFFGEYLGFSKEMLRRGADIAQKSAEKNLFVKDDPRDDARVQQGRQLYLRGSYKLWVQ
ncbi:MAG: polymorphic toxin type 44 domain-containing protein [Angelakisella sp.]